MQFESLSGDFPPQPEAVNESVNEFVCEGVTEIHVTGFPSAMIVKKRTVVLGPI